MSGFHILHLIDDLEVGGAERVMSDLAGHLKMRGYTVAVCSFRNGEVRRKLEREGIEVIILNKNRPYDPVFLFKLASIIKRRRVDLVHSHLIVADIYGWIACKLLSLPFMITVHGEGLTDLRHGGSVLNFIMRRTGRVVAVSEDLRRKIARKASPDNLSTVHNGIEIEAFNLDHRSIPPANIDPRLNESDLIVGSVGRLHPVKGYGYLLEAVPKVKAAVPRVKFVIAGEGVLRRELEEKAERLGIGGTVLFLGHRDDIPEVLSCFDIFVLPSLTEGISISILEAMAASKPVIATDVGGNPEVVEGGTTGVLVKPENPDELARAIVALAENPTMRDAMGRAGRKRVMERFSMKAMVSKYEGLYDDLISETRGRKRYGR